MTPQERELILEVARRLRGTRLAERDPEAERLIQAEIGSQRDALYLLTQAVIVQEQGLRQAQERIRELETAGGGPGRGSFLGGSSSPGPAAPPPPAAAPAGGGSGVGSFLRTAAAAAAGTIGGQLIYDGMRHAFGGGPGLPWTHGAAGQPGAAGFLGQGNFYGGTVGSDEPAADSWRAAGDTSGGGGDFGPDEELAEDEDIEDEEELVDDDDADDTFDDGSGGDF